MAKPFACGGSWAERHARNDNVRANKLRQLGDIHRDPARVTASGHRDGTESVCRNVKRWQNTAMALRWTAAGILEAAKGFRRLKAYKHLPALRAALAVHQSKCVGKRVEDNADVA